MRRLITFDLDMTLLDHQSYSIPESALRALCLLRNSGHVIALATGRDMDNYYSREFVQMVKPDAMIEMNGTKVTVGNDIIYEHLFDKKLLADLISYAKEKGYAIGVTIGEDDYYINSEVVTAVDISRWGVSERRYKDPSDLVNHDIRTLAYVGEPDGAYDIENHFPQLKLPLFSGNTGADIIEKVASKAEGLRRLSQYYNIDMKDTVSFGDSMNDLEILEAAGIGIAMGNGREELKLAADYVTDDIDKDGVWNACKHFQLI